jgi:hypothetical protein
MEDLPAARDNCSNHLWSGFLSPGNEKRRRKEKIKIVFLAPSQDWDKGNSTAVYLTPDLLSDHLLRNNGRATTRTPNRIIAYIWDMGSISSHLRKLRY